VEGVKLLRAKIAVSFFFLSGGMSLALWAVHIPLIEKTVGVTYAELGGLLILSGFGGFAAMQIAGWLIDHIGAKTTTRLGGVIVGLSLFGPAFADSPLWLGLAIFGIGFGLSGVDVPMNAAALQVEKENDRAIFTFFHLFWSVGGLAGAGLGFLTINAGFTQDQTLPVVGLTLSALALFFSTWLLPDQPNAQRENKAENKASGKSNRRVLGFVILAGAMGASGAIIEGVAQDWSALYLRDVQGLSVAAAAWGLAAFNIGMILGRIFIDRIVERKGRGFIILWGSVLAAIAIALQAVAPDASISLFLWFLLGLGISGVVPQIFAAAGEIGEQSHQGRNMARVVGITYIGALAGPSVIGLATVFLPLQVAIGWGAILAIFIALANSPLEKLPK
jgi:MFS family permease